ncbi:MAG: VCBS repeat-containing protein, partial [Candidatus Bipolaricaulota bacterium]|nr:VCBS repeat-containing protein [Candidatus Bipolaricaulota bacterium]MDW8127487.1 VCBS repeat-containing protein [Candidatus Bipolaricaulota bacterium]
KGPVALVTEDFDLNGIPDLAVALFTDNKVQIIYNPSLCPDCTGKIPCTTPAPTQRSEVVPPASGGESPKFEAPPSPGLSLAVAEGPVLSLPRADMNLFAVGDLNGDRQVDVILGSMNSDVILLFQGDKDGTLLAKGDVRIGLTPEKLLTADLDGNGLADVIAVSWRQAQAVVLWSKGSFLFGPTSFFGLPSRVRDALALRLTDSTRDELVLLTDAGPLVWSIPQRGGIMEWAVTPSALSGLKPLPNGLYAYAAFGSNTVAAVSYSNNPGELCFALGASSLGSFRVTQEGAIRTIAVADVNGDGLPDVLGLEEVGRIRVWLVTKGK